MGFIRTRFNPSDPLSKDIADESLLHDLLQKEKLENDVAEFIIDDEPLPATVNASARGKEVDLDLSLFLEKYVRKSGYCTLFVFAA